MLKQLVEFVLGSRVIARTALRRLGGARLVLSYHNVTDAPALAGGDTSLHLPFPVFRAQLDAISALGLRVVSLDDAHSPGDPPSIVITFDDAYEGAVTLAVPELARRKWPATVFVTPGLLGEDAAWWDRLADPASGAVPSALRDFALTACKGQGSAILDAARERSWRVSPAAPQHRIATAAQLRAACDLFPALRIGSHTWSHPNVAVLDRSAVLQELERTRSWLQDRFGTQFVDWLAYPYGLESPLARATAAHVGHRGARRVDGGWDRGTSDTMARPRLNVTSGVSIAGFRARLAGLL